MLRRENFLTVPVRYRGGRRGPRWTLLAIPMIVVGIMTLIGHTSAAAVVVGVVLVVAAPVLWWVGTSRSETGR